jgi:DNA-binding NarL/FixJ family response regulator
MAAGETDLAVRFAAEGACAALETNAPEEALRLVDLAHGVASTSADRVNLLRMRDDALHALRRPAQRLEGLAELAALAEALRDTTLELEVMLRRAAALRLSAEHDRAADLARRVRQLAVERNETASELDACLELGQDLLRADLGEGYSQTPLEADIEGASEAFECAAELARRLDDKSKLAAALRELGILEVSRLRAWYVERIRSGEHAELLDRLAGGERLQEIMETLPVAPVARQAGAYFSEALRLYEETDDRQGAMATIIAMAFMAWGPEIHLGGSARRIEEIRRLSTQLKSLTTESERALADAQMLYGSHVYSRAKVFPDAAIAKGQEAYRAARNLGDHLLEFASAGGVAMAYAEMGAIDEAEEWLAKAAAVASEEPTPYRARELASWRGLVRAAANDADGMRENLQRAVQLATDQGRVAARCRALALLAVHSARLGAERADEDLLRIAEQSAEEVKRLVPLLQGRNPWFAQAEASLARVARARGDDQAALAHGRAALGAVRAAEREDVMFDIVLPAADAVLAAGDPEEAQALRDSLRRELALLAPRFADEEVRARWFNSPTARELKRLASIADLPAASRPASRSMGLNSDDTRLLELLSQGRTNQEIADESGLSTEELSRRMAALFARIGATSRAEATSAALLGRLI